jgi:hypothetical protein
LTSSANATLSPSTKIGGRFSRAANDETGAPEAADLYYRRPPKALAYRHFDSADVAIRYVRDNLNAAQIAGSVLQVGETRFEGAEVAAMVRRLGARPQPAEAMLDA